VSEGGTLTESFIHSVHLISPPSQAKSVWLSGCGSNKYAAYYEEPYFSL